MRSSMRRRDLIRFFGMAAATALPGAALAQGPTVPLIGLLGSGSRETSEFAIAGFGRGLKESGYEEGRNLALEYRWAEGRYDRLGTILAEFVRRPVALIAILGGTPAAEAAKLATSAIPIVFSVGSDPVAAGLVTSMNKPGGNL